ncbi:MAG TPA: Ig-like domain-containing protein [Acidimicrobiales bacterium]|nr:Ig-like domain-containing protein [Acidimicrobiales bacterium]
MTTKISPTVPPPISQGGSDRVGHGSEWFEGFSGAVLAAVTGTFLLAPIIVYLWFLHAYGVNAIFYDQWVNVALLTHSHFFQDNYSGHTTLASLWIQHNENRMLFPNLVVLALGKFTNLNVLTEMYISAILLIVAFGLVVIGHRRDLPSTRLLVYVPIAFLMFSLAQYGNTLFGFQLAWFMVLLTLVAAIFVLDRPNVGWPTIGLAMALAIVGSYSSLQGLLVWVAGLVVLLWRHAARSLVLSWIGAAAVTTIVYFAGFNFLSTSGNTSYLFAHPLSDVEFFVVNVGDLMSRQVKAPGSDFEIMALGVVISLMAVICLVLYARPGHLASSPVGPALICFGLLFAATVTYGRAQEGLSVATQSRYATFNLLILIGCYLCLLERLPRRYRRDHRKVASSTSSTRRRRGLIGLRALVVFLVVFVVVAGAENGRADGAGARKLLQVDDLVAAHELSAPKPLLEKYLFPNPYIQYNQIWTLDELAKAHHLSFFATAEAARLARSTLPIFGYVPPRTRVLKPKNNAVVHGNIFLLATGSSADFNVSSVEFQIRGSGAGPPKVIPAEQFIYGWLAAWATTNVANGTYTIQTVARDSRRQLGESRLVIVSVRN